MIKTNYSDIATRYDDNKYRHALDIDIDLKRYIEIYNNKELNILDLACGTGIFLSKHMDYFPDNNLKWYGIDACEEMLDIASTKIDDSLLKKGLAEDLPYDNQKFDFIANNYAFHHFEHKENTLDEIYRVTKYDGVFKMKNISMFDMKKWWIYSIFPTAYEIDLDRFWKKEDIFNELSKRGFEVEIYINYKMIESKLCDFVEHVRNRDISILTLLDDEEYLKGLQMMQSKIKHDPNTTIVNDFAELICIAKKK